MKTPFAACSGTETKNAACNSTAIEELAARLALHSAAWIAYLRTSRTRKKVCSAFDAPNDGVDTGKRTHLGKLWMISPECPLGCSMAWTTKRDQVLKLIGFSVISEETEWSPVVNNLSGITAFLAGVLVSVDRGLRLTFPVRPSVAIMTTKPRWTVLSSPFIGLTPEAKAFPRTQVFLYDRVGLLFKDLAANMAIDTYPVTSYAHPVNLLPGCITGKAAKRIGCQRHMIGASFKLLMTLGASYNRHTMIIRSMAH